MVKGSRRDIERIMSQTGIYERPLEERVVESSIEEAPYRLWTNSSIVDLPKIQIPGIRPNKRLHMHVAAKLDNTLTRIYDFIGKENIYLIQEYPDPGIRTVSLSYINMEHYYFLQDNYNEAFTIWRNAETKGFAPKIGFLSCSKNSTINIRLEETLDHMLKSLTGNKISLPQNKVEANPLVDNEVAFNSLIDNATDEIDKLFIEQGLEPTASARHNLIGLVQNLPTYILEKQEIQDLFGTDVKTHSINNPNLIRLAAKGVSDNMIRMFYVNDAYPDSIEEVESLANMPLESLYAIWGWERRTKGHR